MCSTQRFFDLKVSIVLLESTQPGCSDNNAALTVGSKQEGGHFDSDGQRWHFWGLPDPDPQVLIILFITKLNIVLTIRKMTGMNLHQVKDKQRNTFLIETGGGSPTLRPVLTCGDHVTSSSSAPG